ncbi:hypothetical protein EF294_10515 [Gordonia oryzae]|uniref:Uncharacterized protein n=1 Tax=Gordonia oryzae TaxID=2487349 RepID=A0A3N4GR17_9ACTN|nr:hypothetical protein EF294_10515 [Gordonia oryzae]
MVQPQRLRVRYGVLLVSALTTQCWGVMIARRPFALGSPEFLREDHSQIAPHGLYRHSADGEESTRP